MKDQNRPLSQVLQGSAFLAIQETLAAFRVLRQTVSQNYQNSAVFGKGLSRGPAGEKIDLRGSAVSPHFLGGLCFGSFPA